MPGNDSLFEMQSIVKRSGRSLLFGSALVVVLIAVSAGAYIWYALPASCDVDAVEQASTVLITQMKRYDDVYSSAANGTRASIDYPVTVMQQILMDTEEVAVPVCMRTAKDELISYMGDVIRAFNAFEAEESDPTIQSLLDASYAHVRAFRMELESVRQCAPRCWPW